MAKQKFKDFLPREKPKKRPRRHKKNLNKNEKRSYKNIINKVEVNARIYLS